MRNPFTFEAEPFAGYTGFDELESFGADIQQEVKAVGSMIKTQQRSKFDLVRVIPDDPNYRKHIPINYKLNAKKIVGDVAQDLKLRGEKAHFWLDIAHWGLVGAEIFAEASLLIGGLAIASPLIGLVVNVLGLGMPYLKAAEEIAARWAATGFSRGVVMGADKRKAKLVKEYFGNLFFPPNHQFPRGRSIAIGNYKMGLLVGYVQGRLLTENQRAIFWRDLGHRMGTQSNRGPQQQWTQPQWVDWYTTVAAVFRRDHLIN